jgi:hypothetical protein
MPAPIAVKICTAKAAVRVRLVAGAESGSVVWSIAPAVLSGIAAICISALAAFRRAIGRKHFGQLMA